MVMDVGSGVDRLVERLGRAIGSDGVEAITTGVKAALSDAIRSGSLRLPDRFRRPLADSYARRLLHRDPATGWTAVVMTWGPGQGTLLHDHAGIWCVEGVVEGEMEVLQYELDGAEGERFRFTPRGRLRALPGSSGALIPPFEYHVLRNALPDATSVTLHVYGGEMDHCHVFEECGDGGYRRLERRLAYSAD